MSFYLKPSSALGLTSVDYLESMQAQFHQDPASLDPGWRYIFELASELGADDGSASALRVEEFLRTRGHLHADLDPLRPPLAQLHDALRACRERERPPPREQALIEAYTGHLTVEMGHIDDGAVVDWVTRALEVEPQRPSDEDRRAALALLVRAEEFERFLYLRFPGKKKFGAEGAETLLLALERILRRAAACGIEEVVIGSMHRGRMNMLATVLQKDLGTLFAEFKGRHPFMDPDGSCADVPYHLGLENTLRYGDRDVKVVLLPNPSHLEAIHPVVPGRVRARQDLRLHADRSKVLGIVLHTDAAVIGQGVVSESLQLSGVEGFATAGTLHLVVNNQLGFTTEPNEARTSRYCTGAWRALDSPVLHVNGDEPDAVVRATEIALDFRQSFGRDVVIDLVVYRRNGHNEMDEPRFTQPMLYRQIEAREPVASSYGKKLVAEGTVDPEWMQQARASAKQVLDAGYQLAESTHPKSDGYPQGEWQGRCSTSVADADLDTGVSSASLQDLLSGLARVPGSVVIGTKLRTLVEERRGTERGVMWATAEALAFASLLSTGTPVRFTGQDIIRGAFSQRHFALTDTVTGERHLSLASLTPTQARFSSYNSPLSEYATLGFEYGYSLAAPQTLVVWEAQFGDFANGAQIMIDQFIVSGEAKWRQPSGLVMLLPHGLEGQGPEHSSCRIERYLQLAAGGNIMVANPSTPANYFHLLRRQVLDLGRRPLIVVAPKTLLRLPAAVSQLHEFESGNRFEPIIVRNAPVSPRKIIFCSGKLAYELEAAAARNAQGDVMVVRLEQLYPMPAEELSRILRCSAAKNALLVWAQEEPANMGAWSWYDRRLEDLAAAAGHPHPRFAYCGRSESASPAGSFHGDHAADQADIVQRALA